MAVKVISKQPVRKLRRECKKCFYMLEYTPLDIKSQYVSDYGGGGDTIYWVVCPRPGCKHKNDVPAREHVG